MSSDEGENNFLDDDFGGPAADAEAAKPASKRALKKAKRLQAKVRRASNYAKPTINFKAEWTREETCLSSFFDCALSRITSCATTASHASGFQCQHSRVCTESVE